MPVSAHGVERSDAAVVGVANVPYPSQTNCAANVREVRLVASSKD